MLPVDVIESDDQVIVKATVPGVKPEDIEVTLTGDLLTIKGEFKVENREERANYVRQERRSGSFCRQIGLPADINPDNVEATFEDGVLTLEMPKARRHRRQDDQSNNEELSRRGRDPCRYIPISAQRAAPTLIGRKASMIARFRLAPMGMPLHAGCSARRRSSSKARVSTAPITAGRAKARAAHKTREPAKQGHRRACT